MVLLNLATPTSAAKVANRFRCVATTAIATNRRHARIVPTTDVTFLDHPQHMTLAHQQRAELQLGEFDLAWMMNAQLLAVPIVQRSMIFKLQRANRKRDPFDRIALPVRPVIGRIDAPFVAGTMMGRPQNPIHDRVTKIHVGRRHVDLGTQRSRAVGEFTVTHPAEQIQIFFDAAVTIGAVATRFGQRAAVLACFVTRQIANVSVTFADQFFGPLVQLIKIVAGEVQVVPLETQPANVVLDRIDVFDFFLGRIGVVEAEVAGAM